MKRKAHAVLFLLYCLLFATTLHAQSAWQIPSNPIPSQASVQPGSAYVSVDLSLETHDLNSLSDSERKSKLSAFFDAIGLRKKQSRQLTLVAQVTLDGITQPAHSFVTFSATNDRNAPTLSRDVVTGYRSPWALSRADLPISVKLSVRDTTDASFDVKAAANAIGGLLPANNLILNAISKPYVDKVMSTAGTVLEISRSSNVHESIVYRMGVGVSSVKSVKFDVIAPSGLKLATITAHLHASDSLLSNSVPIEQMTASSIRPATYSNISYSDGVNSLNAITPIYALTSYRQLFTGASPDKARTFCSDARESLYQKQKLTLVDGESVIVQALREVGTIPISLTSPDPLNSCFTEPTYLTRVREIGFDLPEPGQTTLTRAQKKIIGCWLVPETTSGCGSVDSRQLTSLLQPTLSLAWTPAFIPITEDPLRTSRDAFSIAFRGKFTSFHCAGSDDTDLILKHEDLVFRLDTEFASGSSGRVKRFTFTPVTQDALNCNGRIAR